MAPGEMEVWSGLPMVHSSPHHGAPWCTMVHCSPHLTTPWCTMVHSSPHLGTLPLTTGCCTNHSHLCSTGNPLASSSDTGNPLASSPDTGNPTLQSSIPTVLQLPHHYIPPSLPSVGPSIPPIPTHWIQAHMGHGYPALYIITIQLH